MKTVKQMLLTIAVLLCSAAVSAHDFEVDGIFYNILNWTEKTAVVTFKGSYYHSYKNEYTGSVVIPASVIYNGKTYRVTTIGYSAFRDCSGLTSITIPNSVTTIGYEAFYNCSGLTSVAIGNGVTTIEFSAFDGCSGLTSVTIPNSVTSIGDYAFDDCSGLTSIVVEEGNSHYDSRDNCNAIIETSTNTLIAGCKNTVIPNGVTTIGDYAFRGRTGLTSITIPNSVTTIGDYAFNSCSGLTSIVVEEGNSVYDSRDNCNAIIETSTNTLIAGCMNTSIPNSVTTIGLGAFGGCSGLTSITIPNSVTTIGYEAFYNCSGLTSITIPNGVTTIEDYAFYGCCGLTSVTIPNSVTTIEFGAFGDCSGLTSITIPNSVTTIGDCAFSGCSGLTSITIPNSVTTIRAYAFSGCSGLTSITIPNSVTNIGTDAFDGTAWYDNQPDGVVYAGKVLYKYKGEMPANTSIVVEDGTLGIAAYAFYGCSGLTSITIPNSVTTIKYGAFYNCSGLTSIYVELVTPATVEIWTFSNIPSNATLYVPIGAKAAYEAAEYWSEFTNIVEYENVKSFDLTVSSVGYASMYLDYPVAIPEGVEVYTADRVEGDLLKMEEITGIIPANTGVIIRAAEGIYTFTESDETPATIETNLLKGTVTDTYIAPASNEKHYVLSVVDDVVGMYRPKLNGEGKYLNNANKAYMVLRDGIIVDDDTEVDTGNPGTQLSNGYRFDFSGTTAIEEVVTESTTAVPVYYDLSGRRVENPTKGIYILNGKKVLVK